MNDKIERFLVLELNKEIAALENRYKYLDLKVNRLNSYNIGMLRELYWTLMRALGFAHLHDGRERPSARREWKKGPATGSPAATALSGNIPATASNPRLLIDTTPTHRWGGETGIQRVVREVARAAVEGGTGLPVFISNARLYSYFRHPALPEEIEIADGDKFMMPDASWNFCDEYARIMEQVSRKNGSNIIVLHDLIPVRYHGAVSPDASSAFVIWLDKIVLASDAVVAVSRSAAEDFLAYAAANKKTLNPHMRVGWWSLGADFQTDADEPVSSLTTAICAGATPFFLSVGTLEPRKGYPIALSAFDKLWNSGVDIRYVIVGRRGWNSRALEARIVQNPEFGRRLFWLDNTGDADLRYLYKHARSLVIASFAEGFGLPIVEAAYHGLPAIASDIPIFHEVGNNSTSYFDVLDSDSLAERVREALASPKIATPPPVRTWKDATESLLEMVRNDLYQRQVDGAGQHKGP